MTDPKHETDWRESAQASQREGAQMSACNCAEGECQGHAGAAQPQAGKPAVTDTIRITKDGKSTVKPVSGAARQPEAGEPRRFRKKPVVITAIQYFDWMREKDCLPEGVYICPWEDRGDLATIHTLEGDHIVSNGDWVITGVKGEKYPCKPNVFEATYEPVEVGAAPVEGLSAEQFHKEWRKNRMRVSDSQRDLFMEMEAYAHAVRRADQAFAAQLESNIKFLNERVAAVTAERDALARDLSKTAEWFQAKERAEHALGEAEEKITLLRADVKAAENAVCDVRNRALEEAAKLIGEQCVDAGLALAWQQLIRGLKAEDHTP